MTGFLTHRRMIIVRQALSAEQQKLEAVRWKE